MGLTDSQKAKATRIKRLTFVVFLGLLGLNWAAMANCSGWNEGTMEVKSCVVEGVFARFVANQLYALILYSAFTLFIPLLIYAAILWGIARGAAKALVAKFDR